MLSVSDKDFFGFLVRDFLICVSVVFSIGSSFFVDCVSFFLTISSILFMISRCKSMNSGESCSVLFFLFLD